MTASPAAIAARRPGVTIGARTAGIAGAAAITLAAAALRLGFAFKSIAPNTFYDAAVRSMGLSWHNFFYGAFEPGGSVSIDKAPADLWFQVASVKLLGFSSTALRLPEALAGTAAVALLYALVARLFGRGAGLVAAAALAVMPVAVLTARSDTMDSLMMALLVAAALLAVRAAQAGRAPLAAGAVLGLAFNVKLFEAVVPLPAIAVLFVLVASGPLAPRLRRLAAGGAVFVAVALSWVTLAGLAAPGSRPYPIGSSNGGVWNVVFGFNGIDRLGHAHAAARVLDPPGPLRLFGTTGSLYGSLIGTELLAALVLGALALLVTRPALTASRERRAGAAGVAVWLVLGVGLFSVMGSLHSRYLEALTPAVAAVLGVAVSALARAAARQRRAALIAAAGVVVSVLAATAFARAQPGTAELAVLGAAACALGAATAAGRAHRAPGWAIVAGVLALLAMPAGTSVQLARAGVSNSGRPGYEPAARTRALSRFLQPRTRGMRYEVASSTAIRAGSLIARDQRPVLVLTIPYGRQLTAPQTLARAVVAGQVRYALIAPSRCPTCIPSIRWALRHGTDVSRRAGLPRGSLYRLKP